MFFNIPSHSGDPILGLLEQFRSDPRPHKVNLGVGMYYDEAGAIPFLASVKEAERRVVDAATARVYLPMEGERAFLEVVAPLIFGAALTDQLPLATIQTIGGSGALKIGADFLHRFFPQKNVWVPSPTWDNHIGIFEGAGFIVKSYPYYDPETRKFAGDAMLATLAEASRGDIVLLHPCCHNPTGVDPTKEEWTSILDVLEAHQLLPFFDMAYQGFGAGQDEDAAPIRTWAERGRDVLVSLSFSKTFSLYGERCGALCIRAGDAESAGNVLAQLKLAVRRNYSSPPTHGMRLISTILNDAKLRAQWLAEVEAMRVRIRSMRSALAALLRKLQPAHTHDYLERQTGMFAFTGLSVHQVARLKDEHAIYAVDSGRICVAALNEGNLPVVAKAITEVLRST